MTMELDNIMNNLRIRRLYYYFKHRGALEHGSMMDADRYIKKHDVINDIIKDILFREGKPSLCYVHYVNEDMEQQYAQVHW